MIKARTEGLSHLYLALLRLQVDHSPVYYSVINNIPSRLYLTLVPLLTPLCL